MNEVVINLLLAGKRRVIAGLAETGAAMKTLGTTTDRTGKIMTHTTRRTWLMNQALFTLRRILFGVTIGFLGLGVIALKWGFDYNKAINNASVGFEGFINGTQAIQDELAKLYYIAAITPFTFPQILKAARQLVPYTDTLKQANDITEALSNSLAAVGVANAGVYQRATIQFTHILALGRVTGIQLNALARDQIALPKMLAAYYHTTTATVIEMVKKGLVPAGDAVKALIAYQHTAGYEGKNFALATRTVTGAWATFKDIVGKAMGGTTKGIFSGLLKNLQEVDKAMLPLIAGNKPITLNMIIEALDKGLSPQTHIIINLFNLLYGFVQGLTGTFWLLFYVLDKLVFGPLGWFGKVTHTGVKAARMFGIVIGVATAALIIQRTALYLGALAHGVYTLATNISTKASMINTLWIRRQAAAYLGLTIWQWAATGSTTSLAAAFWVLTVAMLSNPLTWIIAGIVLLVAGLVILYFKWQWFHDLVNKTVTWLKDHMYVLALVPIVGPILMLIGHFQTLYRWIMKVVDASRKVGDIANPGGRGRWWNQGLIHLAKSHLAGGTPNVTSAGSFLVGERGPEIVHLPRGAAVQPNSAMDWGGSGMVQVVIMPQDINLDGRRFAEVMYKHRLDRFARR